MALRINDMAPDFDAETTQGRIRFHEFIGDSWCVLFSHPKDFTPVCTTELGYMAGLQSEFEKRNCKIIGLSVDPVADHGKWAADIEKSQGNKVNYPMIGDSELKIAKVYGMLPADVGETCAGRTAANNATVRTVFVIGTGQEDQTDAGLSDDHRPQLRRSAACTRFHAAHSQTPGSDPGELEARQRRDHCACRVQ
jgi:Peroxiredoxin